MDCSHLGTYTDQDDQQHTEWWGYEETEGQWYWSYETETGPNDDTTDPDLNGLARPLESETGKSKLGA